MSFNLLQNGSSDRYYKDKIYKSNIWLIKLWASLEASSFHVDSKQIEGVTALTFHTEISCLLQTEMRSVSNKKAYPWRYTNGWVDHKVHVLTLFRDQFGNILSSRCLHETLFSTTDSDTQSWWTSLVVVDTCTTHYLPRHLLHITEIYVREDKITNTNKDEKVLLGTKSGLLFVTYSACVYVMQKCLLPPLVMCSGKIISDI